MVNFINDVIQEWIFLCEKKNYYLYYLYHLEWTLAAFVFQRIYPLYLGCWIYCHKVGHNISLLCLISVRSILILPLLILILVTHVFSFSVHFFLILIYLWCLFYTVSVAMFSSSFIFFLHDLICYDPIQCSCHFTHCDFHL